MPSYPPVPREPPIDTEYPRKLDLQFLQGPPMNPNPQTSSYVLREFGFQMPQQPARDLCLQVSQSHLVPPGIPVQSSLQSYHSVPMSKLHHLLSQSPPVPAGTSVPSSFQWHPVSTGKLSQHMTEDSLVPTGDPRYQIPASHQILQMSQSPIVSEATSTQSNVQWHPDPKRDIGPQVSPAPSMKTSPCMYPDPLTDPGLPPLRTHPVNPGPQLTSCSPGNSDCEDSLDFLEPSGTFSNQKVPLNSPERQRKTRIVYSKRGKELLQESFRQYRYPSLEKCMELAQQIGVTKQQIQIWFKNQRAKHKRKDASGVPDTSGGCKAVAGSASSRGPLPVLASDNEESMFPAAHPGQPKANEAGTDPAVAEGTASAEAPLPMASAAQEPEDAQDSGSFSGELWQRVLEDLDALHNC